MYFNFGDIFLYKFYLGNSYHLHEPNTFWHDDDESIYNNIQLL